MDHIVRRTHGWQRWIIASMLLGALIGPLAVGRPAARAVVDSAHTTASTGATIHTGPPSAPVIASGAPVAAMRAGLPGQGTGGWTPTGSMITPRTGFTATVLHDGHVLVAGGCADVNCTGILASAELYDPGTGRWTTTTPMTTPRNAFTATLLPSGNVLVAGGFDGTQMLASAELYDTHHSTWRITSPMLTAREFHTATLLRDGTVLVAGGIDRMDSARAVESSAAESSTELYNPKTGQWSGSGNMTAARQRHMATVLPNGTVLVVRGCADYACRRLPTSGEVYDPSTQKWRLSGPMRTQGYDGMATLLPNGTVLVAGGCANDTCQPPLASADVYDWQTMTWTTTGRMTTPRDASTATVLPSGQVLVAGGCALYVTSSCRPLSSAELYDPSRGTWTATASMIMGRFGQTATLLPDGRVLVAGGNGSGVLATAELYTPGGCGGGVTTAASGQRTYTCAPQPTLPRPIIHISTETLTSGGKLTLMVETDADVRIVVSICCVVGIQKAKVFTDRGIMWMRGANTEKQYDHTWQIYRLAVPHDTRVVAKAAVTREGWHMATAVKNFTIVSSALVSAASGG